LSCFLQLSSGSRLGSGLIFFLIPTAISQHEKARQLHSRRAWVFLPISLAALIQAMAVRRHGYPMMVVMAVMAGALHLY
jgi:hypothetical protein